MTLDEALQFVKDRYGLLESYVTADGKMMYVVKAEEELRAIPEVKMPASGIALFAPEVMELAYSKTDIEALVRRKNPDLFIESGD